MGYYSEPDSPTRDKGKVVFDLSEYATKVNQNMLQSLIHLIQLLKRDCIDVKAEVDKLDIKKLTNYPTSLNKSR